jgi:hypothetical protein
LKFPLSSTYSNHNYFARKGARGINTLNAIRSVHNDAFNQSQLKKHIVGWEVTSGKSARKLCSANQGFTKDKFGKNE